MSRTRRASGRSVVPRWLALTVGLGGVGVGLLVGLSAAGRVHGLANAFAFTGSGAFQGWVLDAVLAVLASTVFLARAHALKTQHRRCLAALLHQANQLDDLTPRTHEAAIDGLGADVSAAMNLSALRLQGRLAQERSFSGQAAHQLRTPLTALGLAIEELTMHPDTPRTVRADLVRSRNEVDRLAGIISDLLTLARRGALPSGQYTTDPAVMAVHATRRWAPSARAAGRDVRVTGALPHCQVLAPAGPTSQVLDVLIDNALKHGTGDVGVSVDAWDDSVRLRVADQGTPERFRAEQHSTAGEGMGLEVAQQLAAACGGQMVRAQHPTTAFDLVLPREKGSAGG